MNTFSDNTDWPLKRKKMLRNLWLTLACIIVIGVGIIDLTTNPNVGFALFYLLPIVMTAWWWGLLPALSVAVVASGVRFAAALLGRGEDYLSIVLWNSISRVIIFTAASFLVAKLKADREKLIKFLTLESELARTDSLTGLPNWRGLEEQLRREISRSRRMKIPLCIGYIDIDNFKRVNDIHGHGVGDECIARLGKIIREALRPEDVVARVGGDEFAVLFNSPDLHGAENVGRRLVQRIVALGEEFQNSNLGASIGIAWFEIPPDEPEEILKPADKVMYHAKSLGKGTVKVCRVIDDDKDATDLTMQPDNPVLPCNHSRTD